MTRMHDRRTRITVGDQRFTGGFENQSGKYALRVAFKVVQSIKSTENTAEATIYNLSENSRSRIKAVVSKVSTQAIDLSANQDAELAPAPLTTRAHAVGGYHSSQPTPAGPATHLDPQFIIEAGYLDTLGVVFKGKALNAQSSSAPPDIVTSVSASDGHEGRRVVNTALAPNSTMLDAIQAIAGSMKVKMSAALKQAANGKFSQAITTFTNGLTLSGTAKSELDKLADTQGFEWSLQDGDLQILLPGESTTEEAIVLSERTGLIGGIVRIVDKKRPNDLVIKGRSLLQSSMRPGRRLSIDSRECSGDRFKTIKVEHSGDTAGGDWFSDFEAVAL